MARVQQRSPDSKLACSKLFDFLLARNTLLVVYAISALISAIAKLRTHPRPDEGYIHPPLQNYAIFRDSFFHLIHHQDLYARYILEYGSYYRYSPAFALLMAPLAVLPYALGAILWTLLNSLALFFAVWALPDARDATKAYALWFAVIPLTVNMQNAQSNALMAALMLGGWIAHERGRPILGSLSIVFSVFIKLFGGLAVLPCLLAGPRKKFIVGGALWAALLAALPLVVVSPSWLAFLYKSWRGNLQADQASWEYGLDIPGMVRTWFHFASANRYVVAVGLLILLTVLLIRRDAWSDRAFRLLALASVLVWVIIFNFRAESPGMIIAVTGVALWYFFNPARCPADSVPPAAAPAPSQDARLAPPRGWSDWLDLLLLAAVFLFTEVATTDAFPRPLRRQLNFYSEVVPVVLVWIKMQYDLLRFRPSSR